MPTLNSEPVRAVAMTVAAAAMSPTVLIRASIFRINAVVVVSAVWLWRQPRVIERERKVFVPDLVRHCRRDCTHSDNRKRRHEPEPKHRD
ncbi:MAG: hypothetical protein M3032_00640 [Verrucomicrobiota bacterium]|nr:hypothetical protein [Verrucomicrobiota bacterium]